MWWIIGGLIYGILVIVFAAMIVMAKDDNN